METHSFAAEYDDHLPFDALPAAAPPSADDLLHKLNPEQLKAVTLPPTSALILAGAGSGKTRVLTTRIAWLLQTQQCWPSSILAVTFTNKAAKEMLHRLGDMLAGSTRGMWVGTFHGLCNRLLRAHWQLAGLPQAFQILDTQDQLAAIKRLMKQHNIDDQRFPPKQLQWFINGSKEEGERPSDLKAHDDDSRRKAEFYQLYENQCQREGVVDFSELLLRSYELLRDHEAVRLHYNQRFRHILVDEFQDTNKLQYAWLKMLAGASKGAAPRPEVSVFAVGDDDQSIYAFRGARVGNMHDFVREFGVTQQIKLEQNYRSHSHILDSANALIERNTGRLGKNLRTSAGAGEPIRIAELPSDFEEAQWVIEEIRQLLREGSDAQGQPTAALRRAEIALLYRSNAQSRVLETSLVQAQIPYRVYGGLRFFERAEIKHALAYLRLVENPHDDTSFLRVLNFPPRGIGARSVEQLQDLSRVHGCSLQQAAGGLQGRAAVAVQNFTQLMDGLRAECAGLSLREIIEVMLEKSGLLAHYQAERDGGDRVENLEELVSAAEAFLQVEGFARHSTALPVDEVGQRDAQDAQAGRLPNLPPLGALAGMPTQPPSQPSPNGGESQTESPPNAPFTNADTGEIITPLQAFLTHAALEAGDNQAQAGQDAVQLMTVHAAKGLEFDAVFICGLEEGLFPHENSSLDTKSLEEERRLMYVAITRARQRLYISYAQTRMLHGYTRYGLRSRFLDELPEHTTKWLSPRNQGFAPPSGGRTRFGSSGSGGGYGGAGSYGDNRKSYSGGYAQGGGSYEQRYENKSRWRDENDGEARFKGKDAADFGSAHVPFKPKAAAGNPLGLQIGDAVFHTKFGEGLVLALQGEGEAATAKIKFPRAGEKWLALGVAKLQKI
jgi:DNA helicase-2/ATP-dependent DNA helicase PcrA